ncbi:hypothetical protein D5R55_11380 [Burkholderia cenocepacia]|uniref:Uncharacterized protein n=1 Tax=Burkholderia cenocepacia TaxID=95486 RepID=A0A3S9N796_9BURK|nr:hypothetical protein D5R55_11380 [Burkholderia cenocepacia]
MAIRHRKHAGAAVRPPCGWAPRPFSQPAHPRRFFFVSPSISRCGKFFCVVKNHAARHNPRDCGMGKRISYLEMTQASH